MTKLVLTDVTNLSAATSTLQTLSSNNAATVAAVENTISRDGTSPNAMAAPIDMNSNRILNLPTPSTQNEPLRLADVGGVLPSTIAAAGTNAAAAAASAAAAAASAVLASSYVGSATMAPKWSTARTITVSGDISGTSPTWDGSTNLTWTGLAIPAGTVTSAKMATGAAVTNIGYTPANKAGDVFTGEVRLNYVASSLSVDSAGFRGIPINQQDNTYTFVVDDDGRMVRHTSASAHTWSVNPVGTTAYPVGCAISIRNVGSGSVTITRNAGVSLRKSGSATDADVVLGQWGMATMVHEATNNWVITGTGIV